MKKKYIKIIKNEKEILIVDRAGYFLYMVDRIMNLRKFNYYFNKNRKRFTVKIFLIGGFFTVVLWWCYSATR